MATRRQEKASNQIRKLVSEVLLRDLSDPRLEAFISVTRVEVAADMRSADVFLSLFGSGEAAQAKTFEAVGHASRHIQSLVARRLRSKFCPILKFYRDDQLKKTIETVNLIEQTSKASMTQTDVPSEKEGRENA